MTLQTHPTASQERDESTENIFWTFTWPGRRTAILTSIIGIFVVIALGLLVRHETSLVGFVVWLNGLQVPLFDTVSRVIASATKPLEAVVIVAALVLLTAWRTRNLITGLGAGFVVGATWVSTAIVKLVVDRPRPGWNLLSHHVVGMETDASFPSAHVVFITALVVVSLLLVWRTSYRWWVMGAGIVLVLLFAFARMYVGVHDPIDVVAGVLYGSFAALLITSIVNFLAPKGKRLWRRKN